MANPDKQIILLAYVTKWATTRGIIVVRNAETTDSGALSKGFLWAGPNHWTTDRVTAEGRWRKAMQKAADLAQKKADRLRRAVALAPKYEDKSAGGEG
jgi:hypothetical protein